MYMNQYLNSKWNRSYLMVCQCSSFLTQGNFWYTPTDEGTKTESAIKEACLDDDGYVFFHYRIQTSWQSYSCVSAHLWQKNETLYLILILLSSFRLRWGVGEVLRAFVELVLHGVNWMATGTQENKVSIPMCFHIFSFLFRVLGWKVRVL